MSGKISEFNNKKVWNDTDLLYVSTDIGAGDFESEKSTFLEFKDYVKNYVLEYEALISQNAPVVTTQTPTILAGQIWEDTIGTVDAADLIVLGGYELISGVLGDVNATYRSAADDSPTFNTSSLAYDGSPYVVSLDADGNLNPFVNTLVGNIVFSYNSVGSFTLTLTGLFLVNKTSIRPIQTWQSGTASKSIIYRNSDNDINIECTSDGLTPANDELYFDSIAFKIYP